MRLGRRLAVGASLTAGPLRRLHEVPSIAEEADYSFRQDESLGGHYSQAKLHCMEETEETGGKQIADFHSWLLLPPLQQCWCYEKIDGRVVLVSPLRLVTWALEKLV